MRKILASFLAASMVASIGATMSFAANTAAYITADNAVTTATGGTFDEVRLTISPDAVMGSSDDITVTLPVSIKANGTTATDFAKQLDGIKFHDVSIDGRVYNLKLKWNTGASLTLQFDPATAVSGLSKTSLVHLEVHYVEGNSWYDIWANTTTVTNAGVGSETVDSETTGDFTSKSVAEVVKSYGDGTPIPLTEKGVGVDKNLNTSGGVQSGSTVYFMIRDDEKAAFDKMEDDNYWKLKVTKGDNGKYIKKVSDVTKNFSGNLFDVNTGKEVSATGGARHRYIKVELNDIYTDDEYKMTLDLRLSATSKAVDTKVATSDDSEIKVKDFSFYLKNIVKSADNDWKVGVNGLMLEPLENDWNNVTWYDEDGDLAHLKFFADSDVDKFFSKLSTKWDNADYASYFNDQDAFKFEFTGSPNLSSTSRADLEIYNPFVDEDGAETIDPATAVIYQVIDGELINVSDSFTYTEGDNGDMAYKARTRFLGTYIICEKEVEEASNGEVPDELAPDEVAPDDTMTPDAKPDNGGKAPANTGRYL